MCKSVQLFWKVIFQYQVKLKICMPSPSSISLHLAKEVLVHVFEETCIEMFLAAFLAMWKNWRKHFITGWYKFQCINWLEYYYTAIEINELVIYVYQHRYQNHSIVWNKSKMYTCIDDRKIDRPVCMNICVYVYPI